MKQSSPTKELALTFWQVLFLLAAILFLIWLFSSPPVGNGLGNSKKAQAQNDLLQTVRAVEAFHKEYGRYPQCGREVNGDRVVSGVSQRDLYAILRNREDPKTAVQNSRGLVFFEGKEQKEPKGGFGQDQLNYDPWGTPYVFVIDGNSDGVVTVPAEWNSKDSGREITAPAIGFSPGKRAGEADQKDDVKTW